MTARSMSRRATGGRWPHIREGEELSCPEVGRLLQKFLDSELEDDVPVSSLADHLEDCKRCGLEAETYGMIKQALARRETVVPPESVDRLREFGERIADDS
jgi:hypothetical protein